MRQDFDRWLEQELGRNLAPIGSRPARPGPARYQASRVGGLTFPRKVAASLAAPTVALAAGGAAAAAASTGSVNPQVWGQRVEAAVASCKAELQGQHGIGACVSAIARQHGAQMRTQHGARDLGQGGVHAGTPWLRTQTSPAASPTATP